MPAGHPGLTFGTLMSISLSIYIYLYLRVPPAQDVTKLFSYWYPGLGCFYPCSSFGFGDENFWGRVVVHCVLC